MVLPSPCRSCGRPLRQGQNALQLALRRRNPQVRDSLVLTDVEALISYRPRTQDGEH